MSSVPRPSIQPLEEARGGAEAPPLVHPNARDEERRFGFRVLAAPLPQGAEALHVPAEGALPERLAVGGAGREVLRPEGQRTQRHPDRRPRERAVELLLEAQRNLHYTEATAAQIGLDLGFQDPAYFSRFFKRLTGVTPRRYRRDSRRGGG